jgi:methylphosphotriester-DNA--protein-cysteine methyltransferase
MALSIVRVVETVAAPAETVYVTRTGAKYHRASCSSLRSRSSPTKLSEAAQRYGACLRCKPPTPKDATAPKDEDLQTLKEPAKQSAPVASD